MGHNSAGFRLTFLPLETDFWRKISSAFEFGERLARFT